MLVTGALLTKEEIYLLNKVEDFLANIRDRFSEDHYDRYADGARAERLRGQLENLLLRIQSDEP